MPLFINDGNEYKWAHKSLMEYFAARFISDDVKGNQDEFLSKIYNSQNLSKYINMLGISYDIYIKGFSRNILKPLLNDFIEYHNRYSSKIINIDKDLIEQRIGLFYAFSSIAVIRSEYNDVQPMGEKMIMYINVRILYLYKSILKIGFLVIWRYLVDINFLI